MKKIILAVPMIAATLTVAAGATQATTQPNASCTPLKVAYAEKNWRDSKPVDGRTLCPARNHAKGRNTVHHFYQYRRYRQIATMKCLPGSEGWFVPNPGSCTTLQNESGLSWHARNSQSGAEWVYQLLGGHSYPCDGYVRRLRCQTVYGGPDPSTFLGRLMNHEIAGELGRSSWSAPG